VLADSNTCPRCFPPADRLIDEPIVFVSPIQDFHRGIAPDILDLPDDNLPVSDEDLQTYVLRQIACELQPEDRLLAAHILSCLDEDGLLACRWWRSRSIIMYPSLG